MRFRIPVWAEGSSAYVNGNRLTTQVTPGTFLTLHRPWKAGDRVELDLPMSLRLEAIDPQHPRTVALMYGPLVLFPLTHAVPSVTREQLLAAKRGQEQRWDVETKNGPLPLLPFTAVHHEPYSTYIHLS